MFLPKVGKTIVQSAAAAGRKCEGIFFDISEEFNNIFGHSLKDGLASTVVSPALGDWIHALLSPRKIQAQCRLHVQTQDMHRAFNELFEKMEGRASLLTAYATDDISVFVKG